MKGARRTRKPARTADTGFADLMTPQSPPRAPRGIITGLRRQNPAARTSPPAAPAAPPAPSPLSPRPPPDDDDWGSLLNTTAPRRPSPSATPPRPPRSASSSSLKSTPSPARRPPPPGPHRLLSPRAASVPQPQARAVASRSAQPEPLRLPTLHAPAQPAQAPTSPRDPFAPFAPHDPIATRAPTPARAPALPSARPAPQQPTPAASVTPSPEPPVAPRVPEPPVVPRVPEPPMAPRVPEPHVAPAAVPSFMSGWDGADGWGDDPALDSDSDPSDDSPDPDVAADDVWGASWSPAAASPEEPRISPEPPGQLRPQAENVGQPDQHTVAGLMPGGSADPAPVWDQPAQHEEPAVSGDSAANAWGSWDDTGAPHQSKSLREALEPQRDQLQHVAETADRERVGDLRHSQVDPAPEVNKSLPQIDEEETSRPEAAPVQRDEAPLEPHVETPLEKPSPVPDSSQSPPRQPNTNSVHLPLGEAATEIPGAEVAAPAALVTGARNPHERPELSVGKGDTPAAEKGAHLPPSSLVKSTTPVVVPDSSRVVVDSLPKPDVTTEIANGTSNVEKNMRMAMPAEVESAISIAVPGESQEGNASKWESVETADESPAPTEEAGVLTDMHAPVEAGSFIPNASQTQNFAQSSSNVGLSEQTADVSRNSAVAEAFQSSTGSGWGWDVEQKPEVKPTGDVPDGKVDTGVEGSGFDDWDFTPVKGEAEEVDGWGWGDDANDEVSEEFSFQVHSEESSVVPTMQTIPESNNADALRRQREEENEAVRKQSPAVYDHVEDTAVIQPEEPQPKPPADMSTSQKNDVSSTDDAEARSSHAGGVLMPAGDDPSGADILTSGDSGPSANRSFAKYTSVNEGSGECDGKQDAIGQREDRALFAGSESGAGGSSLTAWGVGSDEIDSGVKAGDGCDETKDGTWGVDIRSTDVDAGSVRGTAEVPSVAATSDCEDVGFMSTFNEQPNGDLSDKDYSTQANDGNVEDGAWGIDMSSIDVEVSSTKGTAEVPSVVAASSAGDSEWGNDNAPAPWDLSELGSKEQQVAHSALAKQDASPRPGETSDNFWPEPTAVSRNDDYSSFWTEKLEDTAGTIHGDDIPASNPSSTAAQATFAASFDKREQVARAIQDLPSEGQKAVENAGLEVNAAGKREDAVALPFHDASTADGQQEFGMSAASLGPHRWGPLAVEEESVPRQKRVSPPYLHSDQVGKSQIGLSSEPSVINEMRASGNNDSPSPAPAQRAEHNVGRVMAQGDTAWGDQYGMSTATSSQAEPSEPPKYEGPLGTNSAIQEPLLKPVPDPSQPVRTAKSPKLPQEETYDPFMHFTEADSTPAPVSDGFDWGAPQEETGSYEPSHSVREAGGGGPPQPQEKPDNSERSNTSRSLASKESIVMPRQDPPDPLRSSADVEENFDHIRAPMVPPMASYASQGGEVVAMEGMKYGAEHNVLQQNEAAATSRYPPRYPSSTTGSISQDVHAARIPPPQSTGGNFGAGWNTNTADSSSHHEGFDVGVDPSKTPPRGEASVALSSYDQYAPHQPPSSYTTESVEIASFAPREKSPPSSRNDVSTEPGAMYDPLAYAPNAHSANSFDDDKRATTLPLQSSHDSNTVMDQYAPRPSPPTAVPDGNASEQYVPGAPEINAPLGVLEDADGKPFQQTAQTWTDDGRHPQSANPVLSPPSGAVHEESPIIASYEQYAPYAPRSAMAGDDLRGTNNGEMPFTSAMAPEHDFLSGALRTGTASVPSAGNPSGSYGQKPSDEVHEEKVKSSEGTYRSSFNAPIVPKPWVPSSEHRSGVTAGHSSTPGSSLDQSSWNMGSANVSTNAGYAVGFDASQAENVKNRAGSNSVDYASNHEAPLQERTSEGFMDSRPEYSQFEDNRVPPIPHWDANVTASSNSNDGSGVHAPPPPDFYRPTSGFTGRSSQVTAFDDTSLYTYPYSIMDTGREGELEYRPPRPTISWGFGGTLVSVIPKSTKDWNGRGDSVEPESSSGNVQLFDLKSIAQDGTDEDWIAASEALPPLTYPVRPRDLLEYGKMCDRLAKFSVGLSGSALESRAALWRLLALMCRDVSSDWRSAAGAAISGPSHVPMFGRSNSSSFLSGRLTAESPLRTGGQSAKRSDLEQGEAAAQVERLMTEGKGREAIAVAQGAGLWSLALVLSATVDKSLHMQTITEFAKSNLNDGSALQTLCFSMAENDAEIMRQATSEAGLNDWRKTVGMLLTSRRSALSSEDREGTRYLKLIDQLGEALISQRGDVVAGHVCFLLSGRIRKLDHIDIPLLAAQTKLVGGCQIPRGSPAVALQSFVFEAIVNVQTGESFPHLLPFRFLLAQEIASVGRFDVALKHCSSISSAIRVLFESEQGSAAAQILTQPFLYSLEAFEQRLRGHLGLEPSAEKKGKLSALGRSLSSVFARASTSIRDSRPYTASSSAGNKPFAAQMAPISSMPQTQPPRQASTTWQNSSTSSEQPNSGWHSNSAQSSLAPPLQTPPPPESQSGNERLNSLISSTIRVLAPADGDLSPPPRHRMENPPAFDNQLTPQLGLGHGTGSRAPGHELGSSHMRSASAGDVPTSAQNGERSGYDNPSTLNYYSDAFGSNPPHNPPTQGTADLGNSQMQFNSIPVQESSQGASLKSGGVHRRAASDMTSLSQTSEKKPPRPPRKSASSTKPSLDAAVKTEAVPAFKSWRSRLGETIKSAFKGPRQAYMGSENKFKFDKDRGWYIEGEEPTAEAELPPPPPDDDFADSAPESTLQPSHDAPPFPRSQSVQDSMAGFAPYGAPHMDSSAAPYNSSMPYGNPHGQVSVPDAGSESSAASATSAPTPYSSTQLAPPGMPMAAANKYRVGARRLSGTRAYVDTLNPNSRSTRPQAHVMPPSASAIPGFGASRGGAYNIFTPAPAPASSVGESERLSGGFEASSTQSSVREFSDLGPNQSQPFPDQTAQTFASSQQAQPRPGPRMMA